MKYKIGIDVGGTFTDFLLAFDDESSRIYKVLSTPQDPSLATIVGLNEMAADLDLSPAGVFAECQCDRARHDRNHQRRVNLQRGEDRTADHQGVKRLIGNAPGRPGRAV